MMQQLPAAEGVTALPTVDQQEVREPSGASVGRFSVHGNRCFRLGQLLQPERERERGVDDAN